MSVYGGGGAGGAGGAGQRQIGMFRKKRKSDALRELGRRGVEAKDCMIVINKGNISVIELTQLTCSDKDMMQD